jgi:hypothetical protein
VNSTQLISTADEQFLRTVEDWFQSEPEVLTLVRYSRAAGSKSFEFFRAFDLFRERLRGLPPESSVIVFRKPQLPMRGMVDDRFIRECLSTIQAGVEFLVVETATRTAGGTSWFHHEAGETADELRDALQESRGKHVAVGEYPPWLEDSSDVISAFVPRHDGTVNAGIY